MPYPMYVEDIDELLELYRTTDISQIPTAQLVHVIAGATKISASEGYVSSRDDLREKYDKLIELANIAGKELNYRIPPRKIAAIAEAVSSLKKALLPKRP